MKRRGEGLLAEFPCLNKKENQYITLGGGDGGIDNIQASVSLSV